MNNISQQLQQLVKLIQENEEQLAEALKGDLGKPASESFIAEFGFVVGEAQEAIHQLPSWSQMQRVAVPLAQMKGITLLSISSILLSTY